MLSGIVAAAGFFLHIGPAGDSAEILLQRGWYSLRGPRPVTAPVVFVKVDDEAYAHVDQPSGGTYPNEVFADALERIARAGARMILMDYVFQKPSAPEVEARFEAALASTPSVIGYAMLKREEVGPDGGRRIRQVRILPRQKYRQSAQEVVSLVVSTRLGDLVMDITISNEQSRVGEARVPLLKPLRRFVRPDIEAPRQRDMINYYGGPFTIPSIGLARVLDEDEATLRELLSGRVVVVGATNELGIGLSAADDSFRTPAATQRTFGAEIHATIAANLLDGTWLRRMSFEVDAALLIVLVAFACHALLVEPLRRALPIVIGGSMVLLCISYLAFSRFHYFIPAGTLTGLLIPTLVVLRLAIPAAWARATSRGMVDAGPQ